MINEAKMADGRLYVRRLGDTEDWKLMGSTDEESSGEELPPNPYNVRCSMLFRINDNGEFESLSNKGVPDCEDQEEPSDQELLEILNEEIKELQQALEQAGNAESIALRSAELAISKNGEYKNIIMALEQKLKERDASILKLKAKVFNYALVAASAEATEAMKKLGVTFSCAAKKKTITNKILDAADEFRDLTGVEPAKLYLGEYESRGLMAESFTSATPEGSTFDGMDIVLVKEQNHLSCS